MPSVDTRPYLTPAPDTVVAEPWCQDSDMNDPLPERLNNWDALQPVAARRELRIHAARILAECELGADTPLSLCVTWYSPGTGQRGRVFSHVLGFGSLFENHALRIEIPGSGLGGRVLLETKVLLAGTPRGLGPLSPTRPGSVLWEDSHSLLVEGFGSRFPMQYVDFRAHDLPVDSAWHLSLNSLDMHAQAMGRICLWINSRHPAVACLDESKIDPQILQLKTAAMSHDMARQLIMRGLHEEDFRDGIHTYEIGSVGAVMRDLLERAFPSYPPAAVYSMMTTTPELFHTRIQAAFAPMPL